MLLPWKTKRDVMNILSVGGSDPSSGAGIQSDIRAAQALGAHCFCVVTAVTAQNSSRFLGAEPVSPGMVQMQIESILSDFTVDAAVIGMVYDARTMLRISKALRRYDMPIVVDPVIRSTTGGTLLKKTALLAFKKTLMPIADVVTPNVTEAEILSGVTIRSTDDLHNAAKSIVSEGVSNVIITGCEFEKDKISDYVFDGTSHMLLSSKKIGGQNHGGGCNYAFAIAYALAQRKGIVEAARFAKRFAFESILSALPLGKGVRITSPKQDKTVADLADAVRRFQEMSGAWNLIPEVQCNFVYAKSEAKQLQDVAGILGRIVRSGSNLVVAGPIEYGGSRHVGSAVLAVRTKFPKIRSAINIKYNVNAIKKFKEAGFTILSYDRRKEPKRIKVKENSTISWGVLDAIRKSAAAPDIVYHGGDVGKEPMIIVFGTTPGNVLAKIRILTS
jgi:hydroxymethylpyrimidine kinase / phosphomethylpyrimidine kinase / thiamine-phosphate diphosphorylase